MGKWPACKQNWEKIEVSEIWNLAGWKIKKSQFNINTGGIVQIKGGVAIPSKRIQVVLLGSGPPEQTMN